MAQHSDTDMIGVLVHDHREVEETFQQLEKLGAGDHDQRRDLTEQAITELVRHSVAEEAYLYPTTRSVLPDGDKLADEEISEHAEAEYLMKRLEQTDTTDPEFGPMLSGLMTDIRHHVSEEENELFPRLRQALEPGQLEELGKKIQRTKKLAPTRPHPSAPDHPPANKLMAPGAGLVDRLRDAFSHRSTG